MNSIGMTREFNSGRQEANFRIIILYGNWRDIIYEFNFIKDTAAIFFFFFAYV